MKNWLAKNKEFIVMGVIVVVGVIIAIQLNSKYVEPRMNKANTADTVE